MKKSLRYTFLILVVAAIAAGCWMVWSHQAERQKAEAAGDTLTSRPFSISPALRLDSILKQIAEDRQDELDYYQIGRASCRERV